MKMFCELRDALTSIISIGQHQEYTEKEKNYISRLPYEKYEKILRILNNQTQMQDKEYSIYKQSYSSLKFEFVSNVINTENNEYHTTIDSTLDHLILNILSQECLCNYILDNLSSNHIFLPLNYWSNLHEKGHQSILMINNNTKQIYMIDPNGKSDFFDGLFHQEMNFYIETMLSKYFTELNRFGLNYRYIYATEWNPNNISLNKHFKNASIGSGHCVILSLMIIHLINAFTFQPCDAFNMINKLSEDEILYLIKEYSVSVYALLANKY